jgi:hypothetical protein
MRLDEPSRARDYKRRFKLTARTQRWAITMTKVCIRRAMSQTPFPRWHFVSFVGPKGGESRGVVDLIAIRKDHRVKEGFDRGDRLEIVLIQVKGDLLPRPLRTMLSVCALSLATIGLNPCFGLHGRKERR